MNRQASMNTTERRLFYGREAHNIPEGKLEYCPHCDRLDDPLDSVSVKRRHRTGRCVS